MAGILYIVGTPIGNLEDITLRAVRILQEIDWVVCEDTRVASKLLNYLQIDKKLYSLHQHSNEVVLAAVLNLLKQGQILAYITDAGTPGIADPGGLLVAEAVKLGIKVIPIPGVSALSCALSVAGINLQEFVFLGWPPHKKGRQTFFKQVAESQYPVVFFESTYRIVKTLKQLSAIIPSRKLIIARELTKKFETIYRGTGAEILNQLKDTSTKGEFVVIVNKEDR